MKGLHIRIPNWTEFQHYGKKEKRRVVWVKMYTSLLQHDEYRLMSDRARAMLPQLWLLAVPRNGRVAVSLLEILALDDTTTLGQTFVELRRREWLELWKGERELKRTAEQYLLEIGQTVGLEIAEKKVRIGALDGIVGPDGEVSQW